MLAIHFLGKSRFELDGKSIEDSIGAKAFALICLLILNKDRYLSREKIIGYLWPDSNEEAARYNLRYNLWLIKKNVLIGKNGNHFLHIDKDFCSINKDFEFACDILDVMEFKPCESDSINSILKLKNLFRGEFLEGCYFNKCDTFNELIIFERINFERRKVKILKRLAQLYEIEEKFEICLETVNEILEIEPYDEEMVSKILDIYTKCGKRVAAITYYNQFSNHLAGNLGIAPSDVLRNKYEEIRSNLSDYKFDSNGKIQENSCNPNSPNINIISDSIKDLDFFWISDVTKKLLESINFAKVDKLNNYEVLALLSIQPSILTFYDNFFETIPPNCSSKDVSIVNSFIKLISNVCKVYNVKILVPSNDQMDVISLNVILYLEKIKINGLSLNRVI